MKSYKILLPFLLLFLGLSSCKDDDKGSPQIKDETVIENAFFGDSIQFSGTLTDDMPLLLYRVQLYYDDIVVSQTHIKPESNGQYSCKVYAPLRKDISSKEATLRLTLTNEELGYVVKNYNVKLTHCNYTDLTFVQNNGKEYKMTPSGKANTYSITAAFPVTTKGYFVAKNPGGNSVKFGWQNGTIQPGNDNPITFLNNSGKDYAITFNPVTFEATPLMEMTFAGLDMVPDGANYKIELNLEQNQVIAAVIPDLFETWTIDPDFFEKAGGNNLKFMAMAGKYRVIADMELKYLKVQRMVGNDLSKYNVDGGSLWINGTRIGKPDPDTYKLSWWDWCGMCMAEIRPKVFQITLRFNASAEFKAFFAINFGGGELKKPNYASIQSDLVDINSGSNNYVIKPVVDTKAQYVITIDANAGNDALVMKMVKK